MKKLLMVVVMLISFSLVYYTFNEKNIDEASKLNELNLSVKADLKLNNFNVYVSFENSKFTDIYQQIGLYAKENDLVVIALDNTLDDAGLYTNQNYYIYSNHSDLLNGICIDGKKIDFSDLTGKQYYSTHNSKESVGKIKILNNGFFDKIKRKINIYQYNALDNTGFEQLKYLYFTIYSKDDGFINDLQEYLQKTDNSVSVSNETQVHDEDIENNYIFDNLKNALIILIIIFVTVMSTIIIRKNRQYMIRRMMGTSSIKIAGYEFFRIIFISQIIFIITNLLSYFVLCQDINKATIELLKMILPFNIYFAGILLIIFLFNWIFIYLSCNLKYLNNKNYFQRLFNIQMIIKIVMIIFLMTPFITSLKESLPYLMNYLKVKDLKEEITYLYFLNEVPEKSKEIFAYYKDDCYYADFTDYSANIRGAELTNDYESIYPYPYIHANEYYLRNHNIKTLDGKKFDYNKYPHGALLVPEMYKDQDLSRYPSSVEIVYIKNPGEFLNYHVEDIYYLTNPIILLETEYSIFETRITNLGIKTDNVSELKKELEELNGIKVNIINAKYYYDYFMDQSKSALIEFGVNLGIYLIVYLTLVFQSIFTYLEEKGKEISINYIFGFSRIKRHINLFMLNLLAYAIILFGSFKLNLSFNNRILFVSCFMLMEIIIEIICIIYFENKKMVNWLKGEKL